MEIKKIIEHLNKIIDPYTEKSLGDLEAVKKVIVQTNNVVDIKIELPFTNNEDDIKLEIAKMVKIVLGYPGLKIEISRDNTKVELNDDANINVRKDIKYLVIASGKGGVGKSTVTANLAYAFKRLGKKVGIIDVDIYGASIPFVLDMEIKPLDLNDDNEIIPADYHDIGIISTEFFVPRDKPLMWRAPIASQMTKMFFESVYWPEDIDLVVVDMPPGTGDIAIDVRELLPKSDMMIITTPNINASNVAVKAGLGSKEIGHNIVGVIENMSYYYNSCSKEKEYLLGKGGGSLVAEKVKTDLLGEIPLAEIKENNIIFPMNTIQGKVYINIAQNYLEKAKI